MVLPSAKDQACSLQSVSFSKPVWLHVVCLLLVHAKIRLPLNQRMRSAQTRDIGSLSLNSEQDSKALLLFELTPHHSFILTQDFSLISFMFDTSLSCFR